MASTAAVPESDHRKNFPRSSAPSVTTLARASVVQEAAHRKVPRTKADHAHDGAVQRADISPPQSDSQLTFGTSHAKA